MKVFIWTAALCLLVAIAAGGVWLGRWFTAFKRQQRACDARSKAFARQVEDIRDGANEEMKVGTPKADVLHFFEKRGIRVFVTKSDAEGTLIRAGISECSSIACGTDEALIGVRVKLTPQGVVAERPQVVSLYTNCL